jgi:hypothetical protein
MNNSDRLDVLTPIVDALNLQNFHYLKDTQVYSVGGIDFAVFSIFDKRDNWPKADTLFGNKKIALFHGPLDTSTTDVGYVVSSRHFTPDIFDGYDLALLGDIHKRQEIISPMGCKIVYAGSLVQQNFGESLDKHGFVVWDMDTLNYEEVDIQNEYGYYTMNVDNGIVPDVTDMPLRPRLRVKLSNTDTADTKRVVTEIKQKYNVELYSLFNGKKDIANYNPLPASEDNIQYAIAGYGMPAWATINLKGAYIINNNFTVQAGLENILDTHYRHFASGISAPGINAILALRMKI